MARGIRMTFEEKLHELDTKIRAAEERLELLQQEREAMEEKHREEEMGQIYRLMQQKNMSVSELKAMLEK